MTRNQGYAHLLLDAFIKNNFNGIIEFFGGNNRLRDCVQVWAREGKPFDGNSLVEIFDFDTDNEAKAKFDLAMKVIKG